MRLTAFITLLLGTCCIGAEVKDDLLNFVNGDQLHGRFNGIATDSSLFWKRDDVGEDVKFKPSELRRVVLHGSEPLHPLRSLSHIGTVNGDRIPGQVREITDKHVLIETDFAGTLEFPREVVGMLAPNPLGGKVLYQGPFDPEEWSMTDIEHPDGIPAPPKEGEKDDSILRWKHLGSAWYWQNPGTGTALVRKDGMPDRAILRFDIAWKNRLALAVGFHSDFTKPDEIEEADNGGVVVQNFGRSSVPLPGLFGSSYILHLDSNYVMLYRTSFDENGKSRLDRVQSSNSSLRLGNAGKASVEVRCNRVSGEIILFVNGEFVAQWSELEGVPGDGGGYAGKGGGFGFAAQSADSSVKISEVLVADWNGMPDSARSMQVDDSDIVLLSNGTDRISGKVSGLRDGLLRLEGRFGTFEFPVSEIAEVRFAKSRLAEGETADSEEVGIRFHPLGLISGKALGGSADTIRIRNTWAGEMEVKLDSAVMLEFRASDDFMDNWDDEF